MERGDRSSDVLVTKHEDSNPSQALRAERELEKLSMLYIPEVLRNHTECQEFSLGEPERIHNTSLCGT